MQTRIEVNNSDQYLICSYRFSDKTINTIKADVKRFMFGKEKDENYFQFINWQKKENELVVLTMYAYNDIQLPKTFDTIFEINNPDNFIQLDFKITQAIFNGWAPLKYIDRGHKHICIIEFHKDIPNIFNSVPLFDENEALNKNIQLGFCDMTNFENIKKNQKQK